MNIITGFLKGRKIPFSQKKFPEAATTPSKVKEAVFSILGEDLSGQSFLDLFACSGQIGLESISRGSKFVLFNDIDPIATRSIGDTLRSWHIDNLAMVLHMPAKQCLRYCEKHQMRFDIVYADPPYEKKKGRNHTLSRLLELIGSTEIFSENARMLVQHYFANELPEIAGRFHFEKFRRYGTTGLTEYRMRNIKILQQT